MGKLVDCIISEDVASLEEAVDGLLRERIISELTGKGTFVKNVDKYHDKNDDAYQGEHDDTEHEYDKGHLTDREYNSMHKTLERDHLKVSRRINRVDNKARKKLGMPYSKKPTQQYSEETIDEISDDKKRAYVAAAEKDHLKKWMTPLKPEHKTPTGKVKKSWATSPERAEMGRKLDQRRGWINKVSKTIMGEEALNEGNFDKIDLSKHTAGMKAFSHGPHHQGYVNKAGVDIHKKLHQHALKSGYHASRNFPEHDGGHVHTYTKAGGPYTDHNLAIHTNAAGKVWHVEHSTHVDKS